MIHPVRSIRKAGAWLADKAGTLAGNARWPKSVTKDEKSMLAGAAGMGLGLGLMFAGIQIAGPALGLGLILGWLGVLPGLGLQLLGIGAAGAGAAVFGYGMIDGADKHFGAKTALANGVKKLGQQVAKIFTRTRAPSVTVPAPQAAPEGASALAAAASPAKDFTATAQKPEVVAAPEQQAAPKVSTAPSPAR